MNYKIRDFCKIVNGSTPSTLKPEYWDGDISWITPKDMSFLTGRYIASGQRNITEEGYRSCSTTLLPEGTVLLTSRAPIGYLGISKGTVCTNQGFKSLICDPTKAIPEFLYYLLSTKVNYLQSIAGGSTFKELSKEQIGSMEVDLPPLRVQHHIVDATRRAKYEA